MKFESGADKHPALAPFLTGPLMQKPTGQLQNLKEATENLKEILGDRKAQQRSVRLEPSAAFGLFSIVILVFYKTESLLHPIACWVWSTLCIGCDPHS